MYVSVRTTDPREDTPVNSRTVLTAFLVFFAIHPIAAQEATRIDFRLDADISRFHGGDSLTYVEVYYGVSEAALTYRRDTAGLRGGIDMDIEVLDETGPVYSRSWSIPRLLRDTAEAGVARNILSVETLGLPDGRYRAVLRCTDAGDTARSDSVTIPLEIDGYRGAGETLSDIELATRIVPSETRESIFYKNTLEIIPNPSRLYGAGLPVLFFYAEVYNILVTGDGANVMVRASILDRTGKEVVSQTKSKPRTFDSSVEYGSMDVSSLPGGSYTFRLSLLDTVGNPVTVLASREKKFFVYNPDLAAGDVTTRSDVDNVFAFMTEPEADREIRYLRYIADEYEKRQIESLGDLQAKKNFLRAFWAKRDTEAGTTANEGREEYLRRVAYAAESYRERNREGWLADRGRVSILYGKPDEIERYPSPSESAPYEIWQYNAIQGGVIFVFVDKMGFGSYRLVHSTHLNELRNENWYEDEARIR